ncbi:MAG TPA: hypothetical protein GX004_09730 [Firmicutes bacterium]|nr:hypothetical protein [Bacillota bacterium]
MGSEKIVLGSGKLYVVEFSGTIPENAVLETEENRLGYIKGGASIEYTPTFYEVKDDLGRVFKKILTEEQATLKSGILTWDLNKLNKLCNTGSITEDAVNNIRTLKIGGIGNYDGKKYVIHFLHEDPEDGDLRVTIVGSNEAGFTIAFAKDAETVVNAEFKAQPADDDGTLIILQEDIIADTTPANTKLAALTIGTKNLTPAFTPNVLTYTLATTTISESITAIVADPDATVAITVEGAAHVNGADATWEEGVNTVLITVTNGDATKTYTVTVTKS